MRKGSYKNILYFITTVIVITLGIQVYWNYKNYQIGKQQLINEVQISLDNAVNQYYTKLAEENTIGFVSDSTNLKNFFEKGDFKILLKKIDSDTINFKRFQIPDSIDMTGISILNKREHKHRESRRHISVTTNRFNDSTNQNDIFEQLTSKIVVSITQDSLQLKKIDSLVQQEFLRKKIAVDFGLKFNDTLGEKKETKSDIIKSAILSTSSKSLYLPKTSSLQLFFTNEKLVIFKKNLISITLSFLLVSAVIACLLFLLKIITHQKHLAALKNDLISNITHEFKTPIATISAALEGIQNFNQENDQKKTKKYIEMSSGQLNKLNTMVEKILETATLDSDELQLNLEETNLTKLIHTIAEKHKVNSPEKNITFTNSHENIWRKIDVFHFENAINNIVDNAIKYGGNTVGISILNADPHIIIEIRDNGTGLTKAHKEKIFEKFYRVPKGNTHDVKGFGIGLFYTKTIIEKHKGTIQLSLDQGLTNFKITLPNG
ncbi:two-component system phosphate regulon sensor histidine kinase PhoR [Aquimarina sp. EL_43]|uniref:sensor histidine kinase n=1 Tax=unclassified Aquimarina TaxID=2627091 RepID=UPI0018C97743|nr:MULTISPECIES: HAMP domain-containing sensor histidine kinase [unclassified Aquimarina]MBG6131403.1 two-component system phosphate regulon sensor histidine kinase PhoR [Aquimarina sp. EL_35]MBG6151714.1 two-component system phosphate regulon sensor histidine kinase PhoR [Aquimarina sp. EL_32]MBG6169644.1 two-component system phosphate regulon sensor histidine kinase PhoR [Aquimarina sp. EL_43]